MGGGGCSVSDMFSRAPLFTRRIRQASDRQCQSRVGFVTVRWRGNSVGNEAINVYGAASAPCSMVFGGISTSLGRAEFRNLALERTL